MTLRNILKRSEVTSKKHGTGQCEIRKHKFMVPCARLTSMPKLDSATHFMVWLLMIGTNLRATMYFIQLDSIISFRLGLRCTQSQYWRRVVSSSLPRSCNYINTRLKSMIITHVRHGFRSPQYWRYASFMPFWSSMFVKKMFTLTTFSMLEPAASSTAVKFLMHWCWFRSLRGCPRLDSRQMRRTVWDRISPVISSQVSASMGTHPAQKTKPPATIAWERMPSGAFGALSVWITTFDMTSSIQMMFWSW